MTKKLSSRFFVWVTAVAIAVIFFNLFGCARVPPPPLPKVIVEPPPKPVPEPLPAPPLTAEEIDSPRFARISQVAKREIAAGHIPGAVILVGHQGSIVYRRAFGLRAVEPSPQPMTVDTIFDLASLTKVVATTMAIMDLADRGSLKLDAPVATYWPDFAANGKGRITIKQLLMHTSGLRPGLMERFRWSDYDGAMAAIVADSPTSPPGTKFSYSDVNFITLGEIVHRVSDMPLDVYCPRALGPMACRIHV
jgi:CubicO group peptidase (beta-lactamase class C family)